MTPERLKELREHAKWCDDDLSSCDYFNLATCRALLDHVEAQEKALQAADSLSSIHCNSTDHYLIAQTIDLYEDARAEVKR